MVSRKLWFTVVSKQLQSFLYWRSVKEEESVVSTMKTASLERTGRDSGHKIEVCKQKFKLCRENANTIILFWHFREWNQWLFVVQSLNFPDISSLTEISTSHQPIRPVHARIWEIWDNSGSTLFKTALSFVALATRKRRKDHRIADIPSCAMKGQSWKSVNKQRREVEGRTRVSAGGPGVPVGGP